jgi:glutathione S-transferase
MTETLTLYTNPMSRARVTRWMLEETGLPYQTEILEYGTSMKAPAYRAINPMGKVPAIRHGDTVVTENAAICMYLADLVPEKKLAPPVGSPARGPYYRWISFMGPLEQLMVTKAAGGKMPDPGMAGFGSEDDLVQTLEGAVKDRDHLAGDSFTAADLLVSSYIGWYLQFKLLPDLPAFTRFVELHRARPAAARAYELDGPIPAKP